MTHPPHQDHIEVLCPTLKNYSPDWRDRRFPFAIARKPVSERIWERLTGRPAHLHCTACGAVLPNGHHLVYVRMLGTQDSGTSAKN